MSEVHVDDDQVRWAGDQAPRDAVFGFVERYSPWTGRAWLEVRGPSWRVPITAGYGASREALRAAFPDRPWSSEWWSGRFPCAPLGLPPAVATVGAAAIAVAVVLIAGLWGGGLGAAGAGLVVTWPLARLRDGLHVRRAGLRAGPPWSPLVSWHEIREVGVARGRTTVVWVRTKRGVRSGSIPPVLVPALRARLWRLGGLELVERAEGLDETYGRWRVAASGISWGLLLGTASACWLTPAPWTVLLVGLTATAGVVLLGAAVEARATGWGTGAVLWLTALYALALAALSAASAGLVEPLL